MLTRILHKQSKGVHVAYISPRIDTNWYFITKRRTYGFLMIVLINILFLAYRY